MDKDIILSPVRVGELAALITNMVIENLNNRHHEEDMNKMLSVSEACKVFQPAVTRQTINSWSNQGLLQKHLVGGRVYFKLSELLSAGKTLQRYKRMGGKP